MAAETKAILRCAIYTRKSSEEGLEQSFNSLDAQREACHAYILSQRHEGWRHVDRRYDDGGYSGGSMERPGLTRLLQDIDAGRIDTIVVYKVDHPGQDCCLQTPGHVDGRDDPARLRSPRPKIDCQSKGS